MGAWSNYRAPCFAGTIAPGDHLTHHFLVVQYTHMFHAQVFLLSSWARSGTVSNEVILWHSELELCVA